MPYDEFIGWQKYFKKYPIGYREDDRTMKLLQAQGVKAAPEDIFNSLAEMKQARNNNAKSIKGSMLYHMIKSAKGPFNLED